MAVAVVIVPPERTPDELIMANAIAHGLLGAGIGVMRLEVDRGASVAEIAARALAAVASVRAQSDVDTRRIGIVGIGTAGVAVPLAAERDGTAAFLVNVSTSLVGSPEPLAVWAKLRVPSLLVFRSSDANHVPITESLERLVRTTVREAIEVRVLGDSADSPASVAEIVAAWVVKRQAARPRPPKLRR